MRLPAHKEVWGAKYVGFGADDAGGAYNESISEVCEEMQSNCIPLFSVTPNSRDSSHGTLECWQPNPSALSHACLEMFDFVGCLLGIALRTRHPIGLAFPPSFWKYLVGTPRGLADLAAVDAFTMTSMSRLASCPLEEILLNDEQFSDLFDGYFTAHLADGRLVELVPNGARCVRNRRILACYTIGVIPLFFKSMLGCCLHNSPHSTSALTRTCCIPTPLHCSL